MAPPKKDDPHAPKPNKFLPFVAGGLLMIGCGWFVYKMNPGGAVRAEWPEEKKERLEHERELLMREREAANKEKALKARMRRGAR
jgi:hypothetical protein